MTTDSTTGNDVVGTIPSMSISEVHDLASEIIRAHPPQSSCGFSFCCPPLLHVMPEAAAKHPEQLRLQCFVRLSIKAGGTFKPSFSCFLRSCPVLVYARRSEPADSRYLGWSIAHGKNRR